MSKYDDFKQELNALYEKGLKLFEAIQTQGDEAEKKYRYFRANYEIWYSKALPVIRQLLPDRLNDFTMQYQDRNRKKLDAGTYTISDALRGVTSSYGSYDYTCAAMCVFRQVAMVKSCENTFDSRLNEIQTVLQADIFDSEIEAAKHLVTRGFLRAAGAICGVVIEKHLKTVCESRGLTIKKKNPSIAEYNDTLKDNAYDTIEWRRIQRLGDIRNLCDHNKDREPTKEEVEELISGTDRVIKTIF